MRTSDSYLPKMQRRPLARLGGGEYVPAMPGELDDIIALVDCPECGTELRVSYSQIRLHQVAGPQRR